MPSLQRNDHQFILGPIKTNYIIPINGSLIIIFNGNNYEVLFETGCFSSTSKLTPFSIHKLFDCGKLYSVQFNEQWRIGIKSSELKQFSGFICFDYIPELNPLTANFSSNQVKFSIFHFPPEFFCILSARQYDSSTPNFVFGCLKVKAVIDMFKNIIQSKVESKVKKIIMTFRQLWLEFVYFLVRIGYFKIFNYNDFHLFSFIFFLNMFPLGYHIRKEIRLNMFYSFIEYLMIGNRFFIIHGQNIRPVKGRLSSNNVNEIIRLFIGKLPPIINLIDDKTGYAILTQVKDPIYMSECYIIHLETMKILCVFSLFDFEPRLEPRLEIKNIIMKKLFPPSSSMTDSDDDDDSCLLQRRPASGIHLDLIQNKCEEHDERRFIVVKLYIGNRPIIQCFLQKRDGTFEIFDSVFSTILHIFKQGNIFFQFQDYFDGSMEAFIKAIVQCGFEPIFNGTASFKQLHDFFMESHFGDLLKILMCEYETYKSDLCDGSRKSIRETTHFKSFKRVLEMILKLVRKMNISELSPEIDKLLEFLDVLIKL